MFQYEPTKQVDSEDDAATDRVGTLPSTEAAVYGSANKSTNSLGRSDEEDGDELFSDEEDEEGGENQRGQFGISTAAMGAGGGGRGGQEKEKVVFEYRATVPLRVRSKTILGLFSLVARHKRFAVFSTSPLSCLAVRTPSLARKAQQAGCAAALGRVLKNAASRTCVVLSSFTGLRLASESVESSGAQRRGGGQRAIEDSPMGTGASGGATEMSVMQIHSLALTDLEAGRGGGTREHGGGPLILADEDEEENHEATLCGGDSVGSRCPLQSHGGGARAPLPTTIGAPRDGHSAAARTPSERERDRETGAGGGGQGGGSSSSSGLPFSLPFPFAKSGSSAGSRSREGGGGRRGGDKRRSKSPGFFSPALPAYAATVYFRSKYDALRRHSADDSGGGSGPGGSPVGDPQGGAGGRTRGGGSSSLDIASRDGVTSSFSFEGSGIEIGNAKGGRWKQEGEEGGRRGFQRGDGMSRRVQEREKGEFGVVECEVWGGKRFRVVRVSGVRGSASFLLELFDLFDACLHSAVPVVLSTRMRPSARAAAELLARGKSMREKGKAARKGAGEADENASLNQSQWTAADTPARSPTAEQAVSRAAKRFSDPGCSSDSRPCAISPGQGPSPVSSELPPFLRVDQCDLDLRAGFSPNYRRWRQTAFGTTGVIRRASESMDPGGLPASSSLSLSRSSPLVSPPPRLVRPWGREWTRGASTGVIRSSSGKRKRRERDGKGGSPTSGGSPVGDRPSLRGMRARCCADCGSSLPLIPPGEALVAEFLSYAKERRGGGSGEGGTEGPGDRIPDSLPLQPSTASTLRDSNPNTRPPRHSRSKTAHPVGVSTGSAGSERKIAAGNSFVGAQLRGSVWGGLLPAGVGGGRSDSDLDSDEGEGQGEATGGSIPRDLKVAAATDLHFCRLLANDTYSLGLQIREWVSEFRRRFALVSSAPPVVSSLRAPRGDPSWKVREELVKEARTQSRATAEQLRKNLLALQKSGTAEMRAALENFTGPNLQVAVERYVFAQIGPLIHQLYSRMHAPLDSRFRERARSLRRLPAEALLHSLELDRKFWLLSLNRAKSKQSQRSAEAGSGSGSREGGEAKEKKKEKTHPRSGFSSVMASPFLPDAAALSCQEKDRDATARGGESMTGNLFRLPAILSTSASASAILQSPDDPRAISRWNTEKSIGGQLSVHEEEGESPCADEGRATAPLSQTFSAGRHCVSEHSGERGRERESRPSLGVSSVRASERGGSMSVRAEGDGEGEGAEHLEDDLGGDEDGDGRPSDSFLFFPKGENLLTVSAKKAAMQVEETVGSSAQPPNSKMVSSESGTGGVWMHGGGSGEREGESLRTKVTAGTTGSDVETAEATLTNSNVNTHTNTRGDREKERDRRDGDSEAPSVSLPSLPPPASASLPSEDLILLSESPKHTQIGTGGGTLTVQPAHGASFASISRLEQKGEQEGNSTLRAPISVTDEADLERKREREREVLKASGSSFSDRRESFLGPLPIPSSEKEKTPFSFTLSPLAHSRGESGRAAGKKGKGGETVGDTGDLVPLEKVPYARAILQLAKLQDATLSPTESLHTLFRAFVEMRSAVLQASRGQYEIEAMDDELPIFVFVLLQSQLRTPYALSALLSDFLDADSRMDVEGKFVITMQIAAEYIAHEWKTPMQMPGGSHHQTPAGRDRAPRDGPSRAGEGGRDGNASSQTLSRPPQGAPPKGPQASAPSQQNTQGEVAAAGVGLRRGDGTRSAGHVGDNRPPVR